MKVMPASAQAAANPARSEKPYWWMASAPDFAGGVDDAVDAQVARSWAPVREVACRRSVRAGPSDPPPEKTATVEMPRLAGA